MIHFVTLLLCRQQRLSKPLALTLPQSTLAETMLFKYQQHPYPNLSVYPCVNLEVTIALYLLIRN